MMRFANSEYLYWLWIIPLLVMAWAWTGRNVQKEIEKVFGGQLSRFLTSSVSPFLRRVHLILRLSALALLIIALARPQMGMSLQQVKLQGVEIVVALDVSNSMLVEDIKPSRLEYAKVEISRLVEMLSGDKVGLVAFAGSAVLLSPITSDKSALKMYLDGVGTESVERQGTAISKALKEAKGAFERGGIESDDANKTTRVILVVSDGEDQEDDAIAEAKKLSGEGVRIFTLAVGTERGGPIPIRDERGYLKAYKRDQSGQNVNSQVKGSFLRQLADVGRGAFRHASSGGAEAATIKAELDKLEKTEFDSSVQTNFDEKYQVPLFLAMLLILIDIALTDRKWKTGIWRGRFEVNGFVFFFLFAASAQASELKAIMKNHEGQRRFSAEQYHEAQDRFTDALAEDPNKPELHTNIGTTFLVRKEYDKSLSEFEIALKGQLNKDAQFKTLFNAAVASTASGKIDRALDYYQRALEVDPKSTEVKTNIELLLGGGKGGEGDQDQPNKDGQGEGQQNQPQQNQGQKDKPKPKPFKSEDISQQDVNRIMEELKRQEEQVRAKMEREGRKDAATGKDW